MSKRKTIWIARDGDGNYHLSTQKPSWRTRYNWWRSNGNGVDVCEEVAHALLAPADRLKPGEGPKRIKIKLGG